MTTTTYSNKINKFIIPIISVNVMNFSFSNFFTNFTLVRSCISRHFFKPTMPMFIRRRILLNAKNDVTFFRTKSPSSIKACRITNRELFFTGFTGFRYLSFLRFIKTCVGTISPIRMLKSRLQKFKFSSASFTLNFDFRNFQGFIGALFSTKAFFLIFDSMSRNLKTTAANSTNQSATSSFKSVLANARAKKMFVSFNFIRISLKRLITFRALCNHRFYDRIRANLNQHVNQGARNG